MILCLISSDFEELHLFKIIIFGLLQHAGEVYGEKAILATEVKELQSRLLNLADERDKSLAILDEVMKFLLCGDNTFFPFIVWILSYVSTPVVLLEEYFVRIKRTSLLFCWVHLLGSC